ncbi:gamma-glutamyltransferase [Phaeacidiphilus oryzae]|uniref:gamma-glutamyltransferase n=1 Tax=Phaeacidiphilus oryzae TaxID=348818 RepID=UPI00068D0CBB|nr:gamma-glutamyltransferase [Phaeacidiphilus oryzae]
MPLNHLKHPRRHPGSRSLALAAAGALLASLAGTAAAGPSAAAGTPAGTALPKTPVATGYGGAVASVDADATAAGIQVLREGGNAVDAAVATAAALGVTEPFSSGIGGGGYFTYYNARTGKVSTIDGRETAPAADDQNLFVENGKPLPFADAVTSGLSTGVPGSLATWSDALRQWGTRPLGQLFRPAERIARSGFTVDQTFHDQVAQNQTRFAAFPATAKIYLPGGRPPAVGSVLRNPDLARTYDEIGSAGIGALYGGDIGRDVAATVQHPQTTPGTPLTVRPGRLAVSDLAGYAVKRQAPTHENYRGLDVYGIAPSSSGGTTTGEALDILQHFDLKDASQTQYLHDFLESTRLAFADRNRWVGDPAYENVPTRQLTSPQFADSRYCLISPTSSPSGPVAPGDPYGGSGCPSAGASRAVPTGYEGTNTTNMTVADRWGNVVEYTLTIEQTGGNAMVVPGRGFLLNNELTDFDFVPLVAGVPDPNLPAAGKRPRSSISPTIVLDHGRFDFATGSPGGATIITTVLQILLGHIDRGLSLEDAIAAPRASQRNSANGGTDVEQAFLDQPYAAGLKALGETFNAPAEIGAATGIQALPGPESSRPGLGAGYQAAAEPVRRGGGSAAVVRPAG